MLRMFYSEASVRVSVGLFNFRVQVKYRRDAGISDGVGAYLNTRTIGPHHAIAHGGDGVHFIGKQAAIVGLVKKRFEEVGGTGAKRAISEGFYRSDSQVWRTEGASDTDFGLIGGALGDQGSGVDSGCQFLAIKQLRKNRNITVVDSHVLHAGHTDRRGMGEGPLYVTQALLMGRRGNYFKYETLGCIFQPACGIALGVAHDGPARRVLGR